MTDHAQQLDLMAAAVPPYRRNSDTSKAAAESMRESVAELEYQVLEALRLYGPMTSDEVAHAIGRSILSVRPRITELKARGLIADTGRRRANESGRSAAIVGLNRSAA